MAGQGSKPFAPFHLKAARVPHRPFIPWTRAKPAHCGEEQPLLTQSNDPSAAKNKSVQINLKKEVVQAEEKEQGLENWSYTNKGRTRKNKER